MTEQDRREPNPNVTPVKERRVPEQHVPRWIKWTRENENRGKSLDSMRPAA